MLEIVPALHTRSSVMGLRRVMGQIHQRYGRASLLLFDHMVPELAFVQAIELPEAQAQEYHSGRSRKNAEDQDASRHMPGT